MLWSLAYQLRDPWPYLRGLEYQIVSKPMMNYFWRVRFCKQRIWKRKKGSILGQNLIYIKGNWNIISLVHLSIIKLFCNKFRTIIKFQRFYLPDLKIFCIIVSQICLKVCSLFSPHKSLGKSKCSWSWRNTCFSKMIYKSLQ